MTSPCPSNIGATVARKNILPPRTSIDASAVQLSFALMLRAAKQVFFRQASLSNRSQNFRPGQSSTLKPASSRRTIRDDDRMIQLHDDHGFRRRMKKLGRSNPQPRQGVLFPFKNGGAVRSFAAGVNTPVNVHLSCHGPSLSEWVLPCGFRIPVAGYAAPRRIGASPPALSMRPSSASITTLWRIRAMGRPSPACTARLSPFPGLLGPSCHGPYPRQSPKSVGNFY